MSKIRDKKGRFVQEPITEQRIKSKINIDSNGCWNWIRKIHKNGYGLIKISQSYKAAHRISYEFFTGEDVKGKIVRHKCHNRRCINPDHLTTGTHLDNFNDKKEDWKEFIKENEELYSNFLNVKEELNKKFQKWIRDMTTN